MIEFISQPWHWAISGTIIALTMFLLLYFGKRFGVSTTLKTICAIGGAGKRIPFFDYDWKGQIWALVFVFGAIVGGFIASNFLASPQPVQISQDTIQHLASLGVNTPTTLFEGSGYIPQDLLNFQNLLTFKGFILMVVGGFCIGFGTRWAGGCTSGHAISGLSNFQMPSLIAVIGFFIGGLFTTHILLPFLLS